MTVWLKNKMNGEKSTVKKTVHPLTVQLHSHVTTVKNVLIVMKLPKKPKKSSKNSTKMVLNSLIMLILMPIIKPKLKN